MTDIFIIGCGYLGTRVAQKWRHHNRSVAAMARSVDSASKLQAQGITPYRGDLDEASSLNGLPVSATALYYFAPPPATGCTDSRMHHFIAALDAAAPPRQIIYVSTSGVYGDTSGEWVTEESHLNPQADRAFRRVDAEQTLTKWCENNRIPLTILRVAGIYGPDKLPLKRLKAGTPVLREEECGYTNRIHIEDLVNICLKAAGQEGGTEIYNVADGHPSTMSDYLFAVADALNLPRPATVTMEEAKRVLTPAMISYLTESRRIDNGKLLRGLGVELKYPGLEEGLRAIKHPQP